MSDDNVYRDGDIVWVKLGTNWWPGEVCGIERQPQGFLKHVKRKPYCVVKFFQEDSFEYVKTSKQIFPYRCSKRDEFVRKGFALYKARNKFMEKFPSDVQIAEGLAPEIYETPSIIINNRPDSIVKAILGQTLVRTSNDFTSNYGRRNNDTITKIINITPTLSSVSNTTTFGGDKTTILNSSSSNNTSSSSSFNNTNNTNTNNTNSNTTSNINSPNSSVGGNSNLYRCNLCGFTSLRQNVMILHRKTHSNTNNSNNLTLNGSPSQQQILKNNLEISLPTVTASPSQSTNTASSHCQNIETKENTNEKTNKNKHVESPLLSKSKRKQAKTNLVDKKISSLQKTVGGKSNRKSSAGTDSSVGSVKVSEAEKEFLPVEIKDEDSNQIPATAAHEVDDDKSSSTSRPLNLERNNEENSKEIAIAFCEKISEKLNGCFNDDSFESKSIAAKHHQDDDDLPEDRDSVDYKQFTQKRNSEDIRKSLLADWSDEDDHFLEANNMKTNKINALVNEEKVLKMIGTKQKEISEKNEIFIECVNEIEIKYPLESQSITATQSITAVTPVPLQSKIRNIPKKDRRDIILKEFNNGNCQSRPTSLTSVSDVETTSNHKKSTDEHLNVSFISSPGIAEENNLLKSAASAATTPSIDASPPPVVIKIQLQIPTTTAVTASTLSCFDFKEEEDDCDSDLLSSIAKFKKKYLSPDKIAKNQINVELTRKSVGVRSQSIENELKDKQLSDEIESLLNNSDSAIPTTSSSVCSISETQSATGRSLVIKDRGKRIFKSRNRSQLEENKITITTATTTANVLLPSNEADDQKEKLLFYTNAAAKYKNKQNDNDNVEKKSIKEEKFETSTKTVQDESVTHQPSNNESAEISKQETQIEILEDNKEFIETDKVSHDQKNSQECVIADAQRNDNEMIVQDNLLEKDTVNDNQEIKGTQSSWLQQKGTFETVEIKVKTNHTEEEKVVYEEEKFDSEFNQHSVSVDDAEKLFPENDREDIAECDQQLQHSDQQAETVTKISTVGNFEREQNSLSAIELCEKSLQNEETVVSGNQTNLVVADEEDLKYDQNVEIISVSERLVLPASPETIVDSEHIAQKIAVAQSQEISPLINHTEQTTNLHFPPQFVEKISEETLCLNKNNSNRKNYLTGEHENRRNSTKAQEEDNAQELQPPALGHRMEENDTECTSPFFDSIDKGGEMEQQQPTTVAEIFNDEGCATAQYEDFGGEESIPMIVYSPVEIYGGEVQDQNHSKDGQNDKDKNEIMEEHRNANDGFVCEEEGEDDVVVEAEEQEEEEEEEILSQPIETSITPLSILNNDQKECEDKISTIEPRIEAATSVNYCEFHEERSVSSPVNNINESLETRLASPSDENSSVAISEADAEFGSPTSMLDDERMPENHSTAAPPEDESTHSSNKQNKEEITALDENHIELNVTLKTVETEEVEISSYVQESVQSEEVLLTETASAVDNVRNPSTIQSTDCTSQSEVSKSLETEFLEQRTYTNSLLLDGEKGEMLGDDSNEVTNVVDENIEDVEEEDEEDEEEEEEEIESPPHEELSDSESRRSEARKLQEELEKANQKLLVKQRLNLIPDATNAVIEVCQQQIKQPQLQQEQKLQQQEKLQRQQKSSLVNLQRTSPETLLGGEELSAAETLLLIPRQHGNALVSGGGRQEQQQQLLPHIETQKSIEPPTEIKVKTPLVSPIAAKDDCRQIEMTTTTNVRRKRRSHLKVTPRKRIIGSNQDDTQQTIQFETKVRKVVSPADDYSENASKSPQFEETVGVESSSKENEVAAAPVVCGTRTFRPRRVTNYYEGDSQSPTPMEMIRAAAREEAATRKAKRESTKKTLNQQPTATQIDSTKISPIVTAPIAPIPAPQQSAFNIPLQQEKVRINVDVANPLSTQLATIFGSRSPSNRSTASSSGYQESFANKVSVSIARKRKQIIEDDIPSFVIERQTTIKSPTATPIAAPLSQADTDTIAHMQSLCPKLQVTRKEMREKEPIKTLPKATISTPISSGPPQMLFLNQNPNQNKKTIVNRSGGCTGGIVTTNDNITTMLDFANMPIMLTNDNMIHENVHLVITPSSAPTSSSAMTSSSASAQQILFQVPNTLTTVESSGVFINQRQFQIQQQQQQQQSQQKSRRTPTQVRTKRTPFRQQMFRQPQTQQQPEQIPNPQENMQHLQNVEQQRKQKTKQRQQDHQIEQQQQYLKRLQQVKAAENAQRLHQPQIQIQKQFKQTQQILQQQNLVEVKQQVNAFNSKAVLQQEQQPLPQPVKSNKQMGVDSRGNKYVIIKSDANMILNRTTTTDNFLLQQPQSQQEREQIVLQSQPEIQSHDDDHIQIDNAGNTYNIGSGITIRPIYHLPAVTPHSNMAQRKEKSVTNDLTVTVGGGRLGGPSGGIGGLHHQHSTLTDITVKAVGNQQRQVPFIQQQQEQLQQQQEVTITKSQDRNRLPKSINNSALLSQAQVVVQSQLQAIDKVATLRRLGTTDTTSSAPPMKILKSTNSFADALAQQQLITCSTDVGKQMNETLQQIDPIIEQQQQEQQIVHSTTSSHQKIFLLQQLNNKGAIIAVPIKGVSIFILCREEANKYIPIDNTPLYLNKELDKLLPLPEELITDDIKSMLEQLPTNIMQLQPEVIELQTTKENDQSTDSEIHEIHDEIEEISDDNEIIMGGLVGAIQEEAEEQQKATPIQFCYLPGKDGIEIDTTLVQQVHAISQMVGDAGDQHVQLFIPPGSCPEDLSNENALLMDCDGEHVVVNSKMFAQLLSNANPNVNTNLITTGGREYPLARNFIESLLAHHGMRQTNESQQIQIVDTNDQMMLQQYPPVGDNDGDVIVTDIDPTSDATGEVEGASDILAVALAGSDLYSNDVLEIEPSNGMQLVGTDSIVYQQQQKQHFIGTAKEPLTRETTVFNPPIPSTFEIPSSSNKEAHSSVTTHIPSHEIIEASGSLIHSFSGDPGVIDDDDDVDDESALIMQQQQKHQVPISLELPITITNPVIARNPLTPRLV